MIKYKARLVFILGGIVTFALTGCAGKSETEKAAESAAATEPAAAATAAIAAAGANAD